MPRIPVRTTPYHTLPRCTRHYKSKRDLILRALGKASFINGSQFVIAWISPKGEVDVYASELLQAASTVKEGGILGRRELERESVRIRGEMARRWEEVRRLEEKGEAPVLDEDKVGGGEGMEDEAEEQDVDEEDGEDVDPDKTLVEDGLSSLTPARPILQSAHSSSSIQKQAAHSMMSSFQTNTRSSTPAPPMHTLNLAPSAVDEYYASRFTTLQQATCKLVVKAWIKVIEPKKQMKFPYNKGEDLKPTWWPEGVRHREPDHLSKTERLTLLCSIIRSPLVSVSRLELSTAEAAAFISRPRLAILREVYLVGKEEERRRKDGDETTELIVHLPNVPISPSAISPEPTSEKRSLGQYDAQPLDKENMMGSYSMHSQKRMKHSNRIAVLSNTPHGNYESYGQAQPQPPFTFAPQNHLAMWGRGEPAMNNGMAYATQGGHPQDIWAIDGYARSPLPGGDPNTLEPRVNTFHQNHLAPLLHTGNNTSSSASPTIDSPGFPHPHSAQMHPHHAQQQQQQQQQAAAFYPRSAAGQSYMQQQQMEYLQQHAQESHFNYGAPFLADSTWESTYAGPTA